MTTPDAPKLPESDGDNDREVCHQEEQKKLMTTDTLAAIIAEMRKGPGEWTWDRCVRDWADRLAAIAPGEASKMPADIATAIDTLQSAQREFLVGVGDMTVLANRHVTARVELERAIINRMGAAKRDRERDRERFDDPAFNRWLDEGISDAGHTVWDSIPDTASAWYGWTCRNDYAAPPPAARSTEPCAWRYASHGTIVYQWHDMVSEPPSDEDKAASQLEYAYPAPPAPKGEGCATCGGSKVVGDDDANALNMQRTPTCDVYLLKPCPDCAPPEPARQEKGDE